VAGWAAATTYIALPDAERRRVIWSRVDAVALVDTVSCANSSVGISAMFVEVVATGR
jgi:hypothetical protein